MKKTVTAHVYLGRGMTISGDLLTPGTAPVLRGPTDAAPVSARALSVARTSGRASPPVTSSTPRMDPSIFHVASSLCRLPLAVWDSAVCPNSFPWSCLRIGCCLRTHFSWLFTQLRCLPLPCAFVRETSADPRATAWPCCGGLGGEGGLRAQSARLACGRNWGAVLNPIL